MNWRNWKQWTRSNICLWLLIYEINVLICTKDLVKCGFMKLGELTIFLILGNLFNIFWSRFASSSSWLWSQWSVPQQICRTQMFRPYSTRSYIQEHCERIGVFVNSHCISWSRKMAIPFYPEDFVSLDTCVESNEGVLILVLHGLAGVEFKIVKTDLTIRMCDNQ